MSSYLSIYGKRGEDSPACIMSFSRNSDIYQYIYENCHIAYIGIGPETQYSDLTPEDIDNALQDINENIKKQERRIKEYEAHANGNSECIEEIINMREYCEDLIETRYKIELIKYLVEEARYEWTYFDKYLANVD